MRRDHRHCLPYLTLKIVWRAGGGLGLNAAARAELDRPGFVVANAVTLALELGAVALALTLACRWGRRLPAWLVLAPIWVGTGLLAPIVLGVPLGLLVQVFAGGSPFGAAAGMAVSSWVSRTVYGGFIVQAGTLAAAFVLYARGRWPGLFRVAAPLPRTGTTHPVYRLLAGGAAIVAVLCGLVQVAWALGADPSLGTAAQRVFVLVGGPLAVAGAAGTWTLVHRRTGGYVLRPAGAAWLGSGFLFANGLLAGTDGGVPGLVHGYGALAGLVLAITSVLVLAEGRVTAAPAR